MKPRRPQPVSVLGRMIKQTKTKKNKKIKKKPNPVTAKMKSKLGLVWYSENMANPATATDFPPS